MPYEYTNKEELEQDIQEVKHMLLDVMETQDHANISGRW